ncbi:hypothetical protein JTB14_000129 [Gonioctena quinquepunctata]|nr:hypothetical protein JTB14_000129 [Gonioctena quinquepunctata]
MVKTCIVCGLLQSSDADVSFHRFPSNKNVLKLWSSEALSEIRKINLIEIPNKNQETDGTEYKRNVFPLSDIDGELVATTSRKRFSESNESAPRKRIKKAHRFIEKQITITPKSAGSTAVKSGKIVQK